MDYSIKNGVIQPKSLLFTQNLKNKTLIDSIQDIQNEVSLYQTNPKYNTPESLVLEVKKNNHHTQRLTYIR